MVDCVGIWVAREAGVGAGLGASAVVSGGRVFHFEVVESGGGEAAMDAMLLEGIYL